MLRVGDGATRKREPILLAADDPLSAPHKPIGEAICLAFDGGIENFDRVLIVLVREYGAFRIQHEAGRHYLLADGSRVDPMQ